MVNLNLYEVLTEMNLEISYDKVSENQKKALVYALYEMSGIKSIDVTITLNDGTTITPKVVEWDAEETIVMNEDDEIVGVEDLTYDEEEEFDKQYSEDTRYLLYNQYLRFIDFDLMKEMMENLDIDDDIA